MDVSRELVSKIVVNTGWVVDTLVQVINRALEAGNFGEATRALNLVGKHMGMFMRTPTEVTAYANVADRLLSARKRMIVWRKAEDEKEKVIKNNGCNAKPLKRRKRSRGE